ncbi:AAA family ATPase [Microcella sp.]|uniref:AAA family ATPase n=1 Tax=Microcella sp. TaxID=1913979 RepID=UPI00391CCB8D
MYITRIRLKNWRNFQTLDVNLRDYAYIIGPNAAGKSNLLDALRFLRDIARSEGGGLQTALSSRGGVSKVRCLHARGDSEMKIEVWISTELDQPQVTWTYEIGIKREGKGAQRTLVTSEVVTHNGTTILRRPEKADLADTERLTQTSLEQIQANVKFRDLTKFLADISFIHLVPQLLKYSDIIGGNRVESDPFGQGFLERVARSTERSRSARLKRIEGALKVAVPQFTDLRFVKDEATGRPHLEARYAHYRPNAGWQREESFSDGTLRLIALLWSLQDGESILLMEEPELSLNDAIVRQIPALLKGVRKTTKKLRQVIVTTHSEALLNSDLIDARDVVLLEVGESGTTGRSVDEAELKAIAEGQKIGEVMMPKTMPAGLKGFTNWR